jgi:4-amino-4-deoxy-L-arabinose transferase-like glycosyltransferase
MRAMQRRLCGQRRIWLRRLRGAGTEIVLICLGCALRLWWALSVAPIQVSDARWYSHAALALAAGQGYQNEGLPTAYYPVGYPATLAIFYSFFGSAAAVPRVANVVFALGTLLSLFALARAVTGSRLAATLALLAFTLYPADIAYTSVSLSQMLFNSFALMGCALCLGRLWPTTRGLLLGGALLACATLTRHQGAALPLLVIVAWLLQREHRPRWAHALLLSLVFVAALAPWTIRNAVAFGAFVPISTNGGINLYIGNNAGARGRYRFLPSMKAQLNESLMGSRRGGRNEVLVDRRAAQLAWRYIYAHPQATVELWQAKFQHLYGDDDAAFGYWTRKLSNEQQVLRVRQARRLDTIYYRLLLGLGGVGAMLAAWELCSGRRRLESLLWLPASVIAVFTALHLLTFGDPSYHHPMMPWVAIYAGYAVAVASRCRKSLITVVRQFSALVRRSFASRNETV